MKKPELSPRVVTALIGIPVVALIIIIGGFLFFLVALALALLALRELEVATRHRRTQSTPGASLVSGIAYPALLVIMLSAWLFARREAHEAPHALLLLPWLVLLILLVAGVARYTSPRRISLLSVALTALGVLYVGLFAFLPLLRVWPDIGQALIWLTLLGVWAGDTAAYYAGRAWGSRPLTPLSPGKTREGALAGVLATLVTCVIVALINRIGFGHGFALGVLIAFAAPLGDLIESFWKRELGVKDFGALLPGHGGVLDRCDSLLAAAFVAYCYALWRL